MRTSALALGFVAALAAPAIADDTPVNLRLSHFVPPAHPIHATLQAWADSLKKSSNGSITVTIFPSEQLGKAFDQYDTARDGIADVAMVVPGYQPGRFPVSAAAELPFTISDGKRGTTAVDEWYRNYAAKEMKDVKVCVSFLRANAYFQSKTKPIVVPSDIKGMRIRPSDGMAASLITLLGGTNVQASAPGSRDLLDRGVADATIFPWGSTVLFGIDKVVKYHLDMPTEMDFVTIVINKAKYEGMSAAQRKVIDDHCTTEWANRIDDAWLDFEEKGLAVMAAETGHEVTKPTPAQVQLWKDAAKPLTASWAADVKKAGWDADAALAELNAALARHDAKF